MAQDHYQDAAFVEYVVKELVNNKDAVKVHRSVDEMGVLLQLEVDPEDMGRVIGKDGRTAKAVRTLLRVLGAKNNSRVNLKIMEPAGGKGPGAREEREEGEESAPEEETVEVTEEAPKEEPEESNDEEATEVL